MQAQAQDSPALQQSLELELTTDCVECGGAGEVEVLVGEYRGHNNVTEPVYDVRPCPLCGEED